MTSNIRILRADARAGTDDSVAIDDLVARGDVESLDAVPSELTEGLLLLHGDDAWVDALVSRASRSVRVRTVLLGYDTDLAAGSRAMGPRVGRLVDSELSGAIPRSSLTDWSLHRGFVGPKRSESTRLNSSHIQKSRMPSSA